MSSQNTPTWDELLMMMHNASENPQNTGWGIYRYLQAHYLELGSESSRTLLASYFKLRLEHPSLLHSCILSVAVKMADAFPDFKFPAFLDLWGFPQSLRPEDVVKQQSKEGHAFSSLKEKVEKALKKYENTQAIAALPSIIGYVGGYDPKHHFYHVYDSQSRHFVAEVSKKSATSSMVNPQIGGFVRFKAIIPKEGNFKKALIVKNEDRYVGRKDFGVYTAQIKYVNTEKGYFYYRLTSPLRPTPEGTITEEGSAQLSLSKQALKVGDEVRFILFLKRGKDGIKHNYVAEIF